VATAQELGAGGLPREVRDYLGLRVVKALRAADRHTLRAACPFKDGRKMVACLETSAAAQKLIAALRKRVAQPPPDPDRARIASGTGIEYSTAAKRVLGEERLKRLPGLITRYLADEDWVAIQRMCKTMDPDATLACMQQNSEAVFKAANRRVIMSLVSYMDVELPRTISTAQLDVLAEHCDKQGKAWAMCVSKPGPGKGKCDAAMGAFSHCLVEHDLVARLYLRVERDKRRLFGDALYVEFAGLLALLTFDQVKQVRADCHQDDFEAARTCLSNQAIAGRYLKMFRTFSDYLVADAAKSLAGHGVKLDQARYRAETFSVLLQIPLHAIDSLATHCEAAHPEYKNPSKIEDVDNAIACIRNNALDDGIANPAYVTTAQLQHWLGEARSKVVSGLVAKERQKQKRALSLMWSILIIIAGVGFIAVALMPLVLAKRYPDQVGALWKSSAVAALTLVVTIGLLGGALTVVRYAQGAVATESTSPKIRVAEGAFHALDRKYMLEGFSELSKAGLDFVKQPLARISKDKVDAKQAGAFPAYMASHWIAQLNSPQMKRLIVAIHGKSNTARDNIAKIKSNVGTFKSAIGLYKRVDFLLAAMPLLLALLAVLMYLLPLRHTLVDIATTPARAAQAAGGLDAVSGAMTTVYAEVKSTLPFIGSMLVLLPVVGLFLAYAVNPLVQMLLANAVLSVFYIATAHVSTLVLFVGLLSVMVLLVMCLATYLAALTFALGTLRKIFRARFHHGRSLKEFAPFWKWGSLSLLLLLVLPLVYSLAAHWAYLQHVHGAGDLPLPGKYLIVVPLLSMLLYPVVFWAARGVKATRYIMAYPVPPLGQRCLAPMPVR